MWQPKLLIYNNYVFRRSPLSVAAYVLDCDIIINKFKLQSHYYIHFWTNTFGERYKPFLLGITHLFPHNEVVHLPYIAVTTNTRAD